MENKQLCLSSLDYNDERYQNKERIPLGPFCLTQIDKLEELKKARLTLDLAKLSPWHNSEDLLPDITYLRQLTLYLVPVLAQKLNQRHKANENLYFWRWQLTMYLSHFLCSAFEQWRRIQLAAQNPNNFDYQALACEDLHLLNTTSFVVASFASPELHSSLATSIINFMQAENLVAKDKFNQIEVVQYKSLAQKTKTYPSPQALPLLSSTHSLKSSLLTFKNILCQKIFPKNTLIEQAAFGIGIKEILAYPFLPNIKLPNTIPSDSPALREYQAGQSPIDFEPANKFEEFILTQIENYLPTILWDTQSFNNLMQKNNVLLDKYKAQTNFFPSPSIAVDEQTKAFLAYKAEQGATIIMAQHGSHYGTSLNYPMLALEEYEQASVFLTWGWQELEDEIGNFLPFPSLSLAKKAKRNAKADGSILFVTNMRSTYNPRFLSNSAVPELEFDYLLNQLEFFKSIPKKLQNKLIHQEYPYNYSAFKATEIIKKECPWLKTSTQEFFPHYQKASLLIFDYPATTLHAALAANTPFIIFFNPKAELFSARAKYLFDALHEVGILFYSPTEAAQQVEIAYKDINAWWKEPKRSEAIANMAKEYALVDKVDKNALSLFKSLVNSLANKNKNLLKNN